MGGHKSHIPQNESELPIASFPFASRHRAVLWRFITALCCKWNQFTCLSNRKDSSYFVNHGGRWAYQTERAVGRFMKLLLPCVRYTMHVSPFMPDGHSDAGHKTQTHLAQYALPTAPLRLYSPASLAQTPQPRNRRTMRTSNVPRNTDTDGRQGQGERTLA